MTTVTATRVRWLDTVRGLAVVLMVLDHVAYVYGPGPWWLRTVVTRPALPLFLLVAGALWRPGVRRRHVEIGVAAAAASVAGAMLAMPTPDILLVVVLFGLPAMPLAGRAPVVALVVGLTQTLYLPIGWTGYEPGLVVVWLTLGRYMPLDDVAAIGSRLPDTFARVGRYPLTVYVGHLAALAVARWLW